MTLYFFFWLKGVKIGGRNRALTEALAYVLRVCNNLGSTVVNCYVTWKGQMRQDTLPLG